MTRLLIVFALALALGTAAFAQDIICAIDKSSAVFTGKTATDKKTGKLLWQYKCNRNSHLFWIVK